LYNILLRGIQLVQNPWPQHPDHIVDTLQRTRLGDEKHDEVLDVWRVVTRDVFERHTGVLAGREEFAAEGNDELAE
jgi:hypothetical protein